MHLVRRVRTFAELHWWATRQLRSPRGKEQSTRSATLLDWEASKQVKKTCSEVQNLVNQPCSYTIPFLQIEMHLKWSKPDNEQEVGLHVDETMAERRIWTYTGL